MEFRDSIARRQRDDAPMHVALTGATGFIGSHVLTELREHGHDVTALVRDEDQAQVVAARGASPAVVDLYDRPTVVGRLRMYNPEKRGYEESAYWKYETVLKYYEGKHGCVLGANGGRRPQTACDGQPDHPPTPSLRARIRPRHRGLPFSE